MDTYKAGIDSIELQLNLLDSTTGEAVVLSGVDDIEVEITLENDPDGEVFWSGSLQGGDVHISGEAEGEVLCFIDNDDTGSWPIISSYFANVIKSVVDDNFSSGYKYSQGRVHVFNIG